MKYSIYFALAFSLLLFAFSSSLVIAKGSELKFNSIVSAVSQTGSNEGTVIVSIHGVDVLVIVIGDTEIEESGEEIGLADISVGDFVKITSFFSDEGLIAEEIEILDERSEQFRFRGLITATDTIEDSTIITILGVDVTLNSSTDITRRGSGDGNSVLATDLVVGDAVNVRGGVKDGFLVAARIHVGTREQGNIELEGVIVELSDTGFTLDIEGGGTTAIIVDDNTSVSGELIIGAFVEIEGQFSVDFTLFAFEVVVDVDGDGDADDDNQRGKSGVDNPGKGNGSDEDGEDDNNRVEVSAEIRLESDSTEVNGRVEIKYEAENGEVEQEFEIEIEDAPPGTVYSIVVFFGDDSVELGTITADEEGSAEAEFKADDDDPERDLSVLLPDGRDVRDITALQLLEGNNVILEGDFNS